MQVTIRFCSVPPQFRGRKPWGWPGTSHLSSSSNNHTRGLTARRLFRVPPCHKGTIHLQTSMSSPGFKPSPYGTAVSVANHYTGWATKIPYLLESKPHFLPDVNATENRVRLRFEEGSLGWGI
ncbi:hypothetical protein TNCV_4966081 [Trichonephila clavipes]|nr:hypothetical protein TNCV_4966081 [Trichonephila clavipes]